MEDRINNLFHNVRVILTTRGRVNFQPTLSNLCDELLNVVTMVCYPDEVTDHSKNWGDKLMDVVGHPDNINNIDAIRHWCMEYFKEDYFIFMDDNIVFNIRFIKGGEDIDHGNIRNNPLYEIIDHFFDHDKKLKYQVQLFEDVLNKIKTNEYGIVGISQRFGNNRIEDDFVENSRVYGFWAFNRKIFNLIKKDYDVSDFTFKGDFYTFIYFLTHGIKMGVFYKYAMEKEGNANNDGGCSIYRDMECVNREAELLAAKFPEFVKVRNKNAKSWKNLEDTIKDVTIYWKKAYEYGLNWLNS